MISPRQFAVLNPLGVDFDRFLYAPVGDDQQGGLLSVVSALARVGVDPWEQAALLTRMPLDGAVEALSVLLAKLPAGSGRPVDPFPLATHLVSLLPHAAHQSAPPAHAAVSQTGMRTASSRWFMVLLYLGCIVLLVVTQHFMKHAIAAVPSAAT